VKELLRRGEEARSFFRQDPAYEEEAEDAAAAEAAGRAAAGQDRRRRRDPTPEPSSSEDEEEEEEATPPKPKRRRETADPVLEAALLETLRRDYPSLSHWPDHFLLRQSAGALTKAHADMEIRAGRGGRPSLEHRLAVNYGEANRRTEYGPDYDDRHQHLHPARFAPGPLCNIPEMWRQAKTATPGRGADPVAQYDTKSLGLGHRISAKAWAVLHDQGSTEINIGLFTAAATTAPGTEFSGRSCFPPEDLQDLKDAVSLARAALFLVYNWNPALTILQLFLEQIRYGYKAFTNSKDHVTQLTSFINQVLMENARSWQLGQPCMTADDLATAWITFTAGRIASATGAATTTTTSKSDGKKQAGGKWEKLADGALCGRYNEGYCRNRDDACLTKGFRLRHVCSYVKSNGKRCEGRHPEIKH
jgi:hypothetical protein